MKDLLPLTAEDISNMSYFELTHEVERRARQERAKAIAAGITYIITKVKSIRFTKEAKSHPVEQSPVGRFTAMYDRVREDVRSVKHSVSVFMERV